MSFANSMYRRSGSNVKLKSTEIYGVSRGDLAQHGGELRAREFQYTKLVTIVTIV